MLISLNWLKDYLKFPVDFNPEDLAQRLTMSTVEVESITYQGAQLNNVVVGQIKEIIKHPKADKLSICRVDVGVDKYLQIVCGGKNIYLEMKVAVALVDSLVFWHGQKKLQKIERTKIREIESEGMIGAATELGLGNIFPVREDIIDLKNYNAKNGTPLAEVLNLKDVIIEIDNKSLTNRPDLWGHYGLAREIAALYKLKLKPIPLRDFEINQQVNLKVRIENSEDCSRYLGMVIANITISESPTWLKNKLIAIGQKPINNIVDITNYIMFELGQPLHAFDAAKIKDYQIIVKRATGKKITTLDGKERKLTPEILTISDTEKVVALAGIIGGVSSEINNQTTTIIIESANFNASLIRKSSMLLGLRTEASSRFEKSLDPQLTVIAIKRAINLIQEIIPEATLVSNLIDAGEYQYPERVIEVSLKFLQQRLGKTIPLKTIKEILESLSFGVKSKKEILSVIVPSFRTGRDITIPEELVEEVGRIYGYNNIEEKYPLVSLQAPEINWELKDERNIKNFLSRVLGFDEVSNYSLISSADVTKMKLKEEDFFYLKNYISTDQTLIRTNLITGLLKNAQHNLKYFEQFRIFEIGRVFKKKPGEDYRDPEKNLPLPQQQKHLAGVIVGEANLLLAVKGVIADLLDHLNIKYQFQKDENYHPWAKKDSALKIIINDQILGALGEIDQEVLLKFDIKKSIAFFNLNFSKLTRITGIDKKFRPLPKFPQVIKDLSIIVNKNILWGEVEKEVFSSCNLITQIELFDIYHAKKLGEDKKSLAFHITFYHPEHTLVFNEIKQELNKIMNNLEKKFQAIIRKI